MPLVYVQSEGGVFGQSQAPQKKNDETTEHRCHHGGVIASSAALWGTSAEVVVSEVSDSLLGHRTGAGADGLLRNSRLVLQEPVPQVLNPAVTVERVTGEGDPPKSSQVVKQPRRDKGESIVLHVELGGVGGQLGQLSEVARAAVDVQTCRQAE